MLLLAAAGLLAGAVGNAIPTFTVDSSVARGIDEHLAGLLLASGSLAAAVLVLATAAALAAARQARRPVAS